MEILKKLFKKEKENVVIKSTKEINEEFLSKFNDEEIQQIKKDCYNYYSSSYYHFYKFSNGKLYDLFNDILFTDEDDFFNFVIDNEVIPMILIQINHTNI